MVGRPKERSSMRIVIENVWLLLSVFLSPVWLVYQFIPTCTWASKLCHRLLNLFCPSLLNLFHARLLQNMDLMNACTTAILWVNQIKIAALWMDPIVIKRAMSWSQEALSVNTPSGQRMDAQNKQASLYKIKCVLKIFNNARWKKEWPAKSNLRLSQLLLRLKSQTFQPMKMSNHRLWKSRSLIKN